MPMGGIHCDGGKGAEKCQKVSWVCGKVALFCDLRVSDVINERLPKYTHLLKTIKKQTRVNGSFYDLNDSIFDQSHVVVYDPDPLCWGKQSYYML